MKYSIVTFGCRVNQADSLRLEEDLRAGGAVETASRDADLVIVNTCSVTASADQGARQTIRRIARENPNAEIVATGCYATRCPDEVAALPGVIRVIRNGINLFKFTWHDASGALRESRLDSNWNDVIIGSVILIAIILDQLVHIAQAKRRTRKATEIAAAKQGAEPASA